jgi:hypothetical protein
MGKRKGRSLAGSQTQKLLLAIITLHSWRCAELLAPVDPTVQDSLTACSLSGGEAALILARFYQAPPADPEGTGLFMLMESSDSNNSLAPVAMLVNGNFSTVSSESLR